MFSSIILGARAFSGLLDRQKPPLFLAWCLHWHHALHNVFLLGQLHSLHARRNGGAKRMTEMYTITWMKVNGKAKSAPQIGVSAAVKKVTALPAPVMVRPRGYSFLL